MTDPIKSAPEIPLLTGAKNENFDMWVSMVYCSLKMRGISADDDVLSFVLPRLQGEIRNKVAGSASLVILVADYPIE